MNVAQLVQLYAPLAGLIIIAVWIGALGQRVKTLEKTAEELRAAEHDRGSIYDRLLTLEIQGKANSDRLEKMESAILSIQRQLGNLMTGNFPKVFDPGA
jgi:hypothetical protein